METRILGWTSSTSEHEHVHLFFATLISLRPYINPLSLSRLLSMSAQTCDSHPVHCKVFEAECCMQAIVLASMILSSTRSAIDGCVQVELWATILPHPRACRAVKMVPVSDRHYGRVHDSAPVLSSRLINTSSLSH